MLISRQLRKENIAEYVLYMWQVEDIIRAYGLDLGRLRREYIARFDLTDEQRDEMTDWYGDLIRMMREEGKPQGGIETCLNALYGVMLLRLQQKEVSSSTEAAVKEITTFMGMLSDYYKKDKEEGIEF